MRTFLYVKNGIIRQRAFAENVVNESDLELSGAAASSLFSHICST